MSRTEITDEQALWGARAKHLLEQAIFYVDSDDVIGLVDAVLTALRIAAGETDPSVMDGYPFPNEQADESRCICPPDLRERGGYSGGCPVHSLA